MKKINTTRLMQEIVVFKTLISKEQPKLYEPLNEPPIFISFTNKNISNTYFKQYLEVLKMQLNIFEKITPYQIV